jgi:hypothetical protein
LSLPSFFSFFYPQDVEIDWMVIVDSSFAQQLLCGVISPLLRAYFPGGLTWQRRAGEISTTGHARLKKMNKGTSLMKIKMKMRLGGARARLMKQIYLTPEQ